MDPHEEYESESELEATDEQLDLLRELGVDPMGLEGMSMAEAQALIDEIRSEREAARTGRD